MVLHVKNIPVTAHVSPRSTKGLVEQKIGAMVCVCLRFNDQRPASQSYSGNYTVAYIARKTTMHVAKETTSGERH